MAENQDELNMRRQRREELRRKQQKEQRRVKIALVCALIILVACGTGIFFITKNTKGTTPQTQQQAAAPSQATTPATTEATTEPTTGRRNTQQVIHIKAAGDLNITDNVVQSGLAASGYDFTRSFMDVAPILSDADVTVMNFEGNICGEPYGTDRTSAPWEILQGLRNAGVDLLQTANSCAINNGLIGMTSTIQAIHAAGLQSVGAFSTEAELRKSGGFTMVEVKGIKIAFVAFTKGVGGLGMPAGNEKLVNLLYKDYDSTYREIDREGIKKTLDKVKDARPDIIVALLHWGSEYNDVISATQKSIVELMQKNGVDVIIGTHPHMVQEVTYDPLTGKVVAYSLGDFFGDAARGGTNYSIILDLEITKDLETGVTRVTDWSYIPIYTLKESDCDGFRRVVRIKEAMLAYEGNFVDKVTTTCYDDMKYSLERIASRISGKG